MGIGNFGFFQLLVVLLLVVLLFGTKRLRHLGSDLGSAIRGFRSSVKEGEQEGEGDETSEGLQEGEQKPSDAEFEPSDSREDR